MGSGSSKKTFAEIMTDTAHEALKSTKIEDVMKTKTEAILSIRRSTDVTLLKVQVSAIGEAMMESVNEISYTDKQAEKLALDMIDKSNSATSGNLISATTSEDVTKIKKVIRSKVIVEQLVQKLKSVVTRSVMEIRDSNNVMAIDVSVQSMTRTVMKSQISDTYKTLSEAGVSSSLLDASVTKTTGLGDILGSMFGSWIGMAKYVVVGFVIIIMLFLGGKIYAGTKSKGLPKRGISTPGAQNPPGSGITSTVGNLLTPQNLNLVKGLVRKV